MFSFAIFSLPALANLDAYAPVAALMSDFLAYLVDSSCNFSFNNINYYLGDNEKYLETILVAIDGHENSFTTDLPL